MSQDYSIIPAQKIHGKSEHFQSVQYNTFYKNSTIYKFGKQLTGCIGFHIFENRFSLSIWYVIRIIENRRGGPVRQGRDDDSQRCRPLHYHCPRGEQPNLLCVGCDVWQKGKDTVS